MFDWFSTKKAVNPNDDHHADVILKPYIASSIEPLRDAHFTASQMATLISLLKALPPSIQAIPLLRGTYVLSFTPEIASKLSIGGATLMQSASHDGLRAIAVSTDGHILGHGTLVAAQGLHLATAVVGVWQVLAIITAQHYLPDIQQRLTRIEANIQELRQWMEADEKAKLSTSLKSLQEFAELTLVQPVLEDKAVSFWCQHIERLYFESYQISEANQLRLQAQIEYLAQINTADWFNIDQNYRQLIQTINKIDSLAKAILSALVVQAIAINCLVKLNHYPTIQKQRLKDMPEALDKLTKIGHTVIWVTDKKRKMLGGPIDPWGHDAARRREVAAQVEYKIKEAESRMLEVIHLLDQSHTYMEQQSVLNAMGTSLIINADNSGRIIRVSTIQQVL